MEFKRSSYNERKRDFKCIFKIMHVNLFFFYFSVDQMKIFIIPQFSCLILLWYIFYISVLSKDIYLSV